MEYSVTNEKRAHDLFASVLAGDSEKIRTFIAPDMVLKVPAAMPYARTYHGPQGFLDLLTNFGKTWQLSKMEQTELFARADGNSFVLKFELAGTVTATGESFNTTVLESWEFKDGLLVEVIPHWFNIPTDQRAARLSP
jgi:ketosteroid isomerase-like protein